MIDPISRVGVPYEFLISEPLVHPTLAAGATIVSAAANWTLGAYATIVPAATITADFIMQTFTVESCNNDGVFEIEFYHGATDILFAAYRFAVNGGFFGVPSPLPRTSSPVIPANSQIRARLASSDGAANQATLTVSIGYVLTT
jgi:hypothetical protein